MHQFMEFRKCTRLRDIHFKCDSLTAYIKSNNYVKMMTCEARALQLESLDKRLVLKLFPRAICCVLGFGVDECLQNHMFSFLCRLSI